MTTAVSPLLLPDGSRLVHIGPSKTGTTAIQASYHASRKALLAQGVRYAGRSRSPWRAALAASTKHPRTADGKSRDDAWGRLLAEVRTAGEPRVVISSEHFAKANAAAIRRIASDLDRDRVHVVVTLRALARILPSRWQQDVQMGLPTALDGWLRQVLDHPSSRAAKGFWREHRHDRLIARWVSVVGAERVTVIVLDERDHAHVLRVLEQLTGLRPETLTEVRDLANRSLTLPEIEAVRALNGRLEVDGRPDKRLERVTRHRAADYLKGRHPSPSEPRIEMPGWALDRAAEIAAEMRDGIRSSGVRVVGDINSLTDVPPTRTEESQAVTSEQAVEIGAWLGVGMYRAAVDVAPSAGKRAGIGRRGYGFVRNVGSTLAGRVRRVRRAVARRTANARVIGR